MPEKEKGLEDTDIAIDVMASREIDFLVGEKAKRRRQVDDYDYDDPFFESFEGELEAVELECRLEYFFVYKGTMSEDPKKIARRYNKEVAKRALHANVLEGAAGSTADTDFSFEHILRNGASTSAKYNKEPPFSNLVFWLFYARERPLGDGSAVLRSVFGDWERSDTERFVAASVLKKLDERYADPDALATPPSEHRMATYKKRLHDGIEELYKAIVLMLSKEDAYDPSGKTYRYFKEASAMVPFIRFYWLYIAYCVLNGAANIHTVRNRASDYLMSSFPNLCTNMTKMKFYIKKTLEVAVAEENGCLEEILTGNFDGKVMPEKKEENKEEEEKNKAKNNEEDNKNITTPKNPNIAENKQSINSKETGTTTNSEVLKVAESKQITGTKYEQKETVGGPLDSVISISGSTSAGLLSTTEVPPSPKESSGLGHTTASPLTSLDLISNSGPLNAFIFQNDLSAASAEDRKEQQGGASGTSL